MNCPQCGGKSFVLNSRGSEDAKNAKFIPAKYDYLPRPLVYRDHKCKSCGHCHQSVELSENNIVEFREKMTSEIKGRIIGMLNSDS